MKLVDVKILVEDIGSIGSYHHVCSATARQTILRLGVYSIEYLAYVYKRLVLNGCLKRAASPQLHLDTQLSNGKGTDDWVYV